ncbi:MAG: hypothetical protein KAW40_02030 [Candidatus Aenigmarchaeota archaeon]|nr:hypothetical protein [Candidatus Aenigmarchaeota archaeon]
MKFEQRYIAKLERELFSDSVGSVAFSRTFSMNPSLFKKFKADPKLIGGDYRDPVHSRIIRISENARKKVNKYLTSKGLDPVGLPSYLEIKKMPHVCKVLLTDDHKNYILPTGNVGASYNTETDSITFYEAMVSQNKENEKLIDTYKQGIRTANELMGKYHKLRKPLQKLMRFYRTMIDSLQNPEKAEEILVHEYGHKAAQDIKNSRGESLNYQLMSAALDRGDEEKAVEIVEGFNVNATDNITGKKTTMEESTYDIFGRRMNYVLKSMGQDVPGVLKGGHNNSGKRVSQKYASMN